MTDRESQWLFFGIGFVILARGVGEIVYLARWIQSQAEATTQGGRFHRLLVTVKNMAPRRRSLAVMRISLEIIGLLVGIGILFVPQVRSMLAGILGRIFEPSPRMTAVTPNHYVYVNWPLSIVGVLFLIVIGAVSILFPVKVVGFVHGWTKFSRLGPTLGEDESTREAKKLYHEDPKKFEEEFGLHMGVVRLIGVVALWMALVTMLFEVPLLFNPATRPF